MERPVSVTVTCWVIVALSIEAMIGLLSGIAETSLKELFQPIGSPISFSATVVASVVIAAITLVFALLMLRGANWARIVYLTVSAILALCVIVMHSRVPAAVVWVTVAKLAVFGTLLLRPAANRYFASPHPSSRTDMAA